MDNYLQFVASTNLKSLLGRGLVTDQIAAIFELVKNSYDADAKEVHISFEGIKSDEPRLIIWDNGTGMSLADIEKKWMVIGTDSKKSKQYSPIFNRALNGDKGIGRFAVDRLGSRLNLVSVARNSARDEFRIHPYGEANNDWLDIDRRMAQGYSRFFGSRDLIGYVQTYKRYNQGLIPLTNRQGLIENDDFEKLKKFVYEYAIKPLERYYFIKFKKNVNETLEKSKRQINTTTRQIDDIAKEISKYDKDLGKKLKEYVEDIKKQHSQQVKFAEEQHELTKVYSRIAQKETFLHQLIHQSLLDMRNAVAAVDRLEKTQGFCVEGQAIEIFQLLKKSISDSMAKLLTVRDDLTRTRHKTRVDLGENIEAFLNDYEGQFEQYSIQLQTKIEAKVEYLIDVADLKAIINNLISNSIKALREVGDRTRKILVELRETERFVIIKIQDNGCGIDEIYREKIFDPFFSTTQKYGGFGIGLTIVDETLKEYGGALELVEMEKEGACFLAKLRR